ncbi:MAG: peptide chain release factor 2 [Parcubacteria group bacterium]
MNELIGQLEELKKKIAQTWGFLDLDQTRQRIGELEDEVSQPDFWKDQTAAKAKSQQVDELRGEVSRWQKIEKETADALALATLAEADKDSSVKKDIEKKVKELTDEFRQLEFFLLFSDTYDERNAILAVHAGAGGTDAQDWAAMLLRMFLRFGERKGWRVRLLDKSVGQEAGIKSATIEIRGRWAYGHLRSEAGVHRLVRISPFDAEKMRHTSFALVEVLPELENIEEVVKIDDKDLRIDTFMSSGAGGQSVNTTYSAVRVVHIPTDITVSCQNERSQQQNRETALKILKSKLHKLELEKQQEEKRKLRGEYQSAEWGSQIRSYVLQPYQMVKDHRTKYEEKNPDAVLDGKLDGFIESYLRWSVKK